MARSPIGKIHLTESKINAMFGEHNLKFTTTSIKKHLPIFEERLGKNRPLKWEITIKDAKVLFGQFDSDMILDYTMAVSFSLDQSDALELFYDELDMVTSLNLEAENDLLQIEIQNHKMVNDNKFGAKFAPKRNAMKMTHNEYREFMSEFQIWMNYVKDWMNDVKLKNGVLFPYGVEELNSKVSF
jgi:hypothetical protein